MSSRKGGRTALRKLISGSSRKTKDRNDAGDTTTEKSSSVLPNGSNHNENRPTETVTPTPTPVTTDSNSSPKSNNNERGRSGGGNIIQRLRERSRSRSRSSRQRDRSNSDHSNNTKDMLVAVTSCRSDGYYNQKAPGSTFKLPRKAPTNLKLFHELAVGVKDAYAALGATPQNPKNSDSNGNNEQLDAATLDARTVLWDFIGNLDFVRVMDNYCTCRYPCI